MAPAENRLALAHQQQHASVKALMHAGVRLTILEEERIKEKEGSPFVPPSTWRTAAITTGAESQDLEVSSILHGVFRRGVRARFGDFRKLFIGRLLLGQIFLQEIESFLVTHLFRPRAEDTRRRRFRNAPPSAPRISMRVRLSGALVIIQHLLAFLHHAFHPFALLALRGFVQQFENFSRRLTWFSVSLR
jgi:hypothetical protein